MRTVTIISATNRVPSHTGNIVRYYEKVLKDKQVEVKLLSLAQLPDLISDFGLYGKKSEKMENIIREFIEPVHAFIFISPEYNGSFPGILKLFLDAVHPKFWADKSACLTGVATGRAGNLRGMEHLTNILNYLKMHVYYHKLPISKVDTLMDSQYELNDEETKKVIHHQLDGFLKFS